MQLLLHAVGTMHSLAGSKRMLDKRVEGKMHKHLTQLKMFHSALTQLKILHSALIQLTASQGMLCLAFEHVAA